MNYAILINKDNKIKNNYLKKINLTATKDIDNEEVFVEEKTYKAYLKLKEYLISKNINIEINSAYRSEEYQQKIYDDYIIKYGKEYTEKTVALPGTSEHHTGLAIDLALQIDGKNITDSKELLDYNHVFKKIHTCLKEFGFILRYPQQKKHITGYDYEPWHIRYVGPLIANIIEENNYTLEEYLTDFSGILVINKPQGITSFDVVNEISHLFGIKRIGHTGTLDPLASGVLVVTIGKATKVAELLTATYKEYQADVLLGITTDTLDITGNILDKKDVPKNLKIKETLNNYKKTYLQEVPIYSAIKVNGKKLYEYARNNQKIELPKKEVTIKEIELLSEKENSFTFKCLVSKGCYIRSLIRDIGKTLDTYATMTNLIRTKQGSFTINNSNTLDEIKKGNYHLFKIEESLEYPKVIVNEEIERKIRTGQKIKNIYNVNDKVIFLNQENKLLGIYEKNNDNLLAWKNFV